MIRIVRGEEPVELPSIREAERTRVRPSFIAGPFDRVLLGTRYREVGETLWRRQHYKCCYCEHDIRLQGQDVEHYRPASRYWWLAWSWKNLLFACQNCNRWAKNDLFPLDVTSTPLAVEAEPPGSEVPFLVNPSDEDPMAAIHFRFEPSRNQWIAAGRAGDERGAITVALLKLNAQDLVEQRQKHLDNVIFPDVLRIRLSMDIGSAPDVQARWGELVTRLLQPTMPFVAFSHDVLAEVFPLAERAQWKLNLPKP